MELKTKYKVGDKVCVYYHYEYFNGMQIRYNDISKDEYGYIEDIYIQAHQFKKLDERHQFNKKIPMYYIATTYIVTYKVNGKIYEENNLN